MSEAYNQILTDCLFALNDAYDSVDDAWEIIFLDKKDCTREEKIHLKKLQLKLEEVNGLIDNLIDDMSFVVQDEIIRGDE